jgi:hypothetical protein
MKKEKDVFVGVSSIKNPESRIASHQQMAYLLREHVETLKV